ncbi:MAG: hypothetical protein OHK0029_18830 [Armatimonadaceae bacterium]
MGAFQIVLIVLLVAAVGYAVLGFRSRYGALSGRSRFFRISGLGMLIVLLILALAGTYIDFSVGVSERGAAIRQLSYWMICVMLALCLPLVAVLDALETYVAARKEKREFLQNMIREEIEKAQAKKAAEETAAPTASVSRKASTDTVEWQSVSGGEPR